MSAWSYSYIIPAPPTVQEAPLPFFSSRSTLFPHFTLPPPFSPPAAPVLIPVVPPHSIEVTAIINLGSRLIDLDAGLSARN